MSTELKYLIMKSSPWKPLYAVVYGNMSTFSYLIITWRFTQADWLALDGLHNGKQSDSCLHHLLLVIQLLYVHVPSCTDP